MSVIEELTRKAESLPLPEGRLTAAHAQVSFELLLAFKARAKEIRDETEALLIVAAMKSALNVLSQWYADGGQVIFRDVQ